VGVRWWRGCSPRWAADFRSRGTWGFAEMLAGISPGPIDPPVFQTDFGRVGAQICFDIERADGWRRLRRKGAELAFWSSAFAGGSMVNTVAWQHKMPVVSSTRRDTTKICDITGEELARTGRWSLNWAVAPVNLEKVFLHTWPYNRHFDAIRARYGRDVRITTFDEEEWWTILESRSADVRADAPTGQQIRRLRWPPS
jgi:beta-ureidopropionase